MTELERRWKINDHPGAIRFMVWLDSADFASFRGGDNPACGSTRRLPMPRRELRPPSRRRLRLPLQIWLWAELGAGDHEERRHVLPLGWNDGHEVAWTYTDANLAASLGVAIKGAQWHRPDDTVGFFGSLAGASHEQMNSSKVGGTGILNGDGNLSYGSEKVLETYYDFPIGKAAHFALDYQLVTDPAFNNDRGPVSVFAMRLHWEN